MQANALSELFELLPQAALVLDGEGKVIRVNLAAEELLAIGRAKLAGRTLASVVDAPELLLEIRRGIALREAALLSSIHLRCLIAPFPKQSKLCARIKPLGEDATLVLLEGDMRAERGVEEDIRGEINRSAALMSAMLAHEVNNPLSGIRGAAQLLGEDASEENKPLATLICKEVDRIRSVLDRVEMFADRSELPKSSINIHEALRHAKQVAEHGFARDVKFIERYDPSLPDITTHRDSVVHILLNLMKNACEAMKEVDNPTLTLISAAHHNPRGGFSVAIEVADNGPGIPEHLRGELFKPFVTTHETGRGLGLAICSKLAGDIGAKLDLVDDTHQSGTRFRLLLEKQ